MARVSGRNKYSLLNAITAILFTLINGALGILVTRLIIVSYGSDFNGLNSTVNQIVNVLMVLEGGFTIASNVALFAPVARRDYGVINGILSATSKKFKRIGVLFLLAGTVTSVVYSMIANSNLPRELIATIVIMAVIPAAFNLYFASKYRVYLQAKQQEYIISSILIVTVGLGHITNIVIALLAARMWLIRLSTMSFALLNSLFLAIYVRRKEKDIDFSAKATPHLIVGTRDVMFQKVTGAIYFSFPLVYLSISAEGGTVAASIYALYNSVFFMIKALLKAIIDAPRLSLGHLLSEKEADEVLDTFIQYELLSFMAIFVMLATTHALISPFIHLYAARFQDANYLQTNIATVMALTSVFEMMHIPSGHLINMSGNFKASKVFQSVACIMLIIAIPIGNKLVGGIGGILYPVLFVAIVLALMEILFVHTKFFDKAIGSLLRHLMPLLVVGVLTGYYEAKLSISIRTINSFILFGSMVFVLNVVLSIVVSFFFNRKTLASLRKRIHSTGA